MQLHRHCQDQRMTKAELTKKAAEKKRLTQERKNKPLYKMIQSYDKSLVKEEHTVATLRDSVHNPMYEYVHLPGLRLEGEEVKTESEAECRKFCNTNGECKAFSYNKISLQCFWSKIRLDYDPHYVFYVKDRKNGGIQRKFYAIPGLRGAGDATDNAMASGETPEKASFGECKYDCFSDPTCESFAYNEEDQECSVVHAGMYYDVDFQYYEKKMPIKGGRPQDREVMEKAHTKENSEKSRLKALLNAIMKEEQEEEAERQRNEKAHKFKHRRGATSELGDTRGAVSTTEYKPSKGGWTQLRVPVQT